jgi:hypothetical protein
VAGLTFTVDISEVLNNLGKLDKLSVTAAKKARGVVGDELLRLSQAEVPHDEGTLANTGISEEDGDDQIVAYNTPYAARLHEHPEYQYQKGRKGKYLEDPIKHNQSAFREIFKTEFTEGLK